jgi:putative transposase
VSPKRQHVDLYLRWQQRHLQAVAIANFLRALLRHLRGHISVLWDRGSIHRGPAIEALYQAHAQLHLEEFPAYAPELNSVEQLWTDFTGHTANSVPWDRRALYRSLDATIRRIRRSRAKLRSFILTSKPLSPP